jgi:lysylphosphatidylglycerol synthetase-like protein (DUF2156 family)
MQSQIMKAILTTIVLTILVSVLTFISSHPTEKFNGIFFVLIILIFCASIASLMLMLWFKGTFQERLKKASSFGFPLAALAMLLGYFYVVIDSIIQKY